MEHTLQFDSELRYLPFLFDPARVALLFQDGADGTPAGGGVGGLLAPDQPHLDLSGVITSCELQDVKYLPHHPQGARCVATYELVTESREQSDPPARVTIGVVELTRHGLTRRLFTQDPELPWLTRAADPGVVCERLSAPRPRNDGRAGPRQMESCAVLPVRYKPGSRCVFRYDVRTSAGPQVFFGKSLAGGSDKLAETVNKLHELSEREPAMPRILPVLAHWSDLRTLVQRAVRGGVELNSLAFSSQEDIVTRERWIREAGARLSALHRYGPLEGPVRNLQDDLAELSEYVPAMERAAPQEAARYKKAMRKIERLAEGRAESSSVAGHGAFRTDQFMIEDGRLVMIDLDSFCRANPARDVGNFLAYLDWKEMRKPDLSAFVDRARRAFLEGYGPAGLPLDPEWLDLYRAASLLKIAGRRYRSLSFREWPLVPRLTGLANDVLSRFEPV
jgi:hypothetical protein